MIPPKIQQIINKFKNQDKLMELRKELLEIGQKISGGSLSNPTLCTQFTLPIDTIQRMLKLFEVSEKELGEDFASIGFSKLNNMYKDPYYHVFLVAYYLGLINNNSSIKLVALTNILARLWNGRKMIYIKFCNDDTMTYVYNHMLKNSAVTKKYFPPIKALTNYFAPTLDKKYAPFVEKDIKHLKTLFDQCWNRINQMMKQIAKHYYEAYSKGYKEESNSLMSVSKDDNERDREMVTNYETLHAKMESVIDNLSRHMIMTHNYRLPQDVLNEIKNKSGITIPAINDILKTMVDINNKNTVQECMRFLILSMKVKDIEDICSGYPTIYTIDKLLIKKSELNAEKFKEQLDNICKKTFGDKISNVSKTQILKLRKAAGYILLFRLQQLQCNKNSLDKINI